MQLPVEPGTNILTILGYNRFGQLVDGASNQVTVVNEAAPASPIGNLVISELMPNPAIPDAEYVELHNRSATTAFDLSGWQFNGIDFTFPSGSMLAPDGYLVLAKSRILFANAYGVTTPVFGEFGGNLQPDGETLSLLATNPVTGEEIVVDRVRYESAAPWPTGANGTGASLQLVDVAQDNARVSNWSDGQGWRFFSYTGISGPNNGQFLFYLDTAGSVYLDDMSLVEGTEAGVGSNLLTNGGFELPLQDTWLFRGVLGTNSDVSAAVSHSGNQSLHVVFTAPGNVGNYIYHPVSGIVPTSTLHVQLLVFAFDRRQQHAHALGLAVPAHHQSATGSWPPPEPRTAWRQPSRRIRRCG